MAGYITTNNTNANMQITESMITFSIDTRQAAQLLYTSKELTGVVSNFMVFAISQTTSEMGMKRNLMRKKNGNFAFFSVFIKFPVRMLTTTTAFNKFRSNYLWGYFQPLGLGNTFLSAVFLSNRAALLYLFKKGETEYTRKLQNARTP